MDSFVQITLPKFCTTHDLVLWISLMKMYHYPYANKHRKI